MKCFSSESKPNAPHVPHVEPACGLDNDGPFWSGKFPIWKHSKYDHFSSLSQSNNL